MRGSGFRYGQRTSNQGSGRVRQDSGCAEYEESADSNPCPDFDNDSPNSLTRVRDPFN